MLKTYSPCCQILIPDALTIEGSPFSLHLSPFLCQIESPFSSIKEGKSFSRCKLPPLYQNKPACKSSIAGMSSPKGLGKGGDSVISPFDQ